VSRADYKVLHVDTERTWRGGEQQMLYLASGLQERGVETAVICQPDSPCAAKVRAAGVACFEQKMRGESDLLAARDIARISRAGRFSIIHAHTSHAHTLAVVGAKLFGGAPVAVVHRRVDFRIRPRLMNLGIVKYRLGVDHIIAISRVVRSVLMAGGVPADSITVIHSAVDLSRFENAAAPANLRAELGVPENAFLIGNVGYLVGHKAHEYLLRAAAAVLKDVPEAWFVIVGSGPREEELKAEAQRQGVAARVTFTGFRRDVPQLLKVFDLFALSSWGEGLCSALLESMAAGCPIVATAAGGVCDVIRDGHNGILTPVRNAEALARGIIRVAKDPALARRLAENGRRVVRREFSAETMVERTLELYGRLIRPRPPCCAGPRR